MKFFNTAGPCDPARHYMIPATRRLADEHVMRLIEQQSYFVLHAPRRVGKTTAVLELARNLTGSGKYMAARVSMEVGRGLTGDLGAAERAILHDWRADLEFQLPNELLPAEWHGQKPHGQKPHRRFNCRMSCCRRSGLKPPRGDKSEPRWRPGRQSSPRPLVVFLDEIDALEDEILISVLQQLRSGYNRRPRLFPASLALVGLRDVRDYKVMSGGSARLGTPSPFNIAVRSLTLRNFTADEVKELLTQHTAETGQVFTEAALQLVFELTQGQPWLVNALAKVCVEELVEDVNLPVEAEHIEQAKEILIERRQTHLDQLADKLR